MVHNDTNNTSFNLLIVSPDQVLFEGQATKLTIPGLHQDLAILPDHTPLYAQLGEGPVTIEPVGTPVTKLKIESGIIRVRANRVSLITGFGIRGHILGSEQL
jgi:F-type H+-transporting ATPase subunit epsilon